MLILYTSPILIPTGILLILFSDQVAEIMNKAFTNTARDAGNPFVYKIIGIVIIITSIVGLIWLQ